MPKACASGSSDTPKLSRNDRYRCRPIWMIWVFQVVGLLRRIFEILFRLITGQGFGAGGR